jgi:hypothetical protein
LEHFGTDEIFELFSLRDKINASNERDDRVEYQ